MSFFPIARRLKRKRNFEGMKSVFQEKGKRVAAALLCGVLTAQCLILPVRAEVSESVTEICPEETEAPEVSAPAAASLRFVLFSGEDGTVTVTAAAGGFVTAPDYTALYENKVLSGWRTAEHTGAVEYAPGEEVPVTGDAVYYAVWRSRRICTVTFGTPGGIVTRSVQEGDTVSNVPAVNGQEEGWQFVGWRDADGLICLPDQRPVWSDTTYTPAYAPSLTTDHVSYIHGYQNGTFVPEGTLSRAEAAVIFAQLMDPVPDTGRTFPDVTETAWYARAAAATAQVGAILTDQDGSFRPDSSMTRAEFFYALVSFFPLEAAGDAFTDVPEDYWAGAAINYAAAQGWVSGYGDGTVHPDEPITRAEAVSTLNRVLGRTGDPQLKTYHIAQFMDVPGTHWAFSAVMEAATEHTWTLLDGQESWTDYPEVKLAPGFHYQDGELTYVDPDTGWYVSNTTVNGFRFDETGRYTSGSRELDGYVKAVLASVTNDSMSREQMLHAAFNYTRDNFTYLRRNYYQIGDTGWEMENALVMFQTGYGNCYCYTAVFYYLSRQLGYESTAISGVVGTRRDPHGWVEIDFNGVTYIFDTELEMAYRKKGVYSYDFYMMSYSRIPWPYEK